MRVNVAIPEAVQEIIDRPCAYIVPEDVAKVLKISSMTIREQARAGMLDYPCMDTGTRIRFPKIPFLRWLGYEIGGNES